MRRAPRRAWLVVAVATAVGACTPGGDEVREPDTVESCDGLVAVGEQLVMAYVRVLEEVRVDALTSEETLPELTELGRLGDDLDASVARLGCDPVELNGRIADEVDDVVSDSPAAAILLDIVEGGVVSVPPPPVTSPTP